MDESLKLAEKILNEKLAHSSNNNNFKGPAELTVEITLNEYRALVASDAVKAAKIDEANSKRWSCETEVKLAKTENASLKEENVALKEEIYGLKKCIENLSTELEELKAEKKPESPFDDEEL